MRVISGQTLRDDFQPPSILGVNGKRVNSAVLIYHYEAKKHTVTAVLSSAHPNALGVGSVDGCQKVA